jgi:hypothetical protein
VVTLPDLATHDDSRAIREMHAQHSDRPAVAVPYRNDGVAHLEPSRSERDPQWLPRLLGHQNRDIDMADEILALFAVHRER